MIEIHAGHRPGVLSAALPGSCALTGYHHLSSARSLPSLPGTVHAPQAFVQGSPGSSDKSHLARSWSLTVRAASTRYSAGRGTSVVRCPAWSSMELWRPAQPGSFARAGRARCPAGSLVHRIGLDALTFSKGSPDWAGRYAVVRMRGISRTPGWALLCAGTYADRSTRAASASRHPLELDQRGVPCPSPRLPLPLPLACPATFARFRPGRGSSVELCGPVHSRPSARYGLPGRPARSAVV